MGISNCIQMSSTFTVFIWRFWYTFHDQNFICFPQKIYFNFIWFRFLPTISRYVQLTQRNSFLCYNTEEELADDENWWFGAAVVLFYLLIKCQSFFSVPKNTTTDITSVYPIQELRTVLRHSWKKYRINPMKCRFLA